MIGKKVRLRLLEKSDLELVARWRNDPRIAQQFFGYWPFALSEQEIWYANYVKDSTQRMFIVESPSGSPIGTMALTNIDHRNQTAELGRVLIGDQNHLSAGCAKEAVTLLVDFAFYQANIHRIEVRVLHGNTVAQEMYLSCGFSVEGILRDAIWKDGRYQDIAILSTLRGKNE